MVLTASRLVELTQFVSEETETQRTERILDRSPWSSQETSLVVPYPGFMSGAALLVSPEPQLLTVGEEYLPQGLWGRICRGHAGVPRPSR